MGAWGAGALSVLGPLPYKHPGWPTYSLDRKISVLASEIQLLRSKKSTPKRQARITELTSLRKAIMKRKADKERGVDTSSIDDEIALIEEQIAGDAGTDTDVPPPASTVVYAPPAAPAGPSPLLLLGGVVVVGGLAYALTRKR
jgi:hypothetical protein